MAERIQDALRRSGALGAKFDGTFPHRLLGPRDMKRQTEEEVRQDYKEQEEYRRRLMDAGLIESEKPLQLPENKLNSNQIRVLRLYLNDVTEKFEVFDELLRRVELFKEIINSRFLFKSILLDKESGFRFPLIDGGHVPLRALSSGEQHELVLAYELLFRVSEKSMILIDEPELSLHVTWQQKFLEDIAQISELADLDFVVATHSPQIIHDRTDLMVALGTADQ